MPVSSATMCPADAEQGVAHPESSLGDAAADAQRLETIYRRHHAFVWRSLRRLGVPDASLDDAVQDVFLVVVRRLDVFEERAAITSWLFGIALRIARVHRRKQGRRDRLLQAVAHQGDPQPHPSPSAKSEATQLLHRLLDELDEDKRAVFILAELERFSAPEIGTALDLNVNTVYTRLRAARQTMDKAVRRHRARERRVKP